MRARGLLAILVAPLATAAVGIACRDPTQITVEVTTDVKCADLRGTTITVGELGGLDAVPITTQTTRCDPATGRIGSMVVVPSGANNAEVAVRVVVGLGKDPAQCIPPAYGAGCIVARRALRFVPHESLSLPIFMAASCNGIACGATETCVQGDCRSAVIEDPSQCTSPASCEEGTLRPSVGGADAGAPDASPTKPACDATGSACTSSVPAGWSPVAFARARDACPLGYDALDLVTDPTTTPKSCKCNCTPSPTDPPSCAQGNLTGMAGNGAGVCNVGSPGLLVDGGACIPTAGTSTENGMFTPLPLAAGTCSSTPGVDQGAAVVAARACVPSAPACVESACSGAVPAGFASCIAHDGDAACPAGPFVNRAVAVTSADVACGGCATCTNTATCSTPILRFYADGACATLVTSVTVDGKCNAAVGTAGAAVGGAKYEVTTSNVSCTPTSMPTAVASLVGTRTICCR